jgi:hypothetical protein
MYRYMLLHGLLGLSAIKSSQVTATIIAVIEIDLSQDHPASSRFMRYVTVTSNSNMSMSDRCQNSPFSFLVVSYIHIYQLRCALAFTLTLNPSSHHDQQIQMYKHNNNTKKLLRAQLPTFFHQVQHQ